MQFVQTHQPWIHAILAKHGDIVSLEYGVSVPILGQPYNITATTPARAVAELKAIARDYAMQRIQDHATTLNTPTPRLRLSDTISRWGSYSSSGCLSISWRLVFAPLHVLEYVLAHEMAHTLHMNHSKAFWQVVHTLHPECQHAIDWLKHHGRQVFRYSVF